VDLDEDLLKEIVTASSLDTTAHQVAEDWCPKPLHQLLECVWIAIAMTNQELPLEAFLGGQRLRGSLF
jgi:hypothetical protein